MKQLLKLRVIVPAVLVLLFIGLIVVPRIEAGKYREPARQALERALGRKVEVGDIRFRLLPMPGFTISNVIVGEDPRIGPEPVAYITTMQARPRITALLTGRLSFASVDLEDTSVNLTRVDRGAEGVRWNFASLAVPGADGRPAPAASSFPVVHMSGGRVNFKFGDTKSVFYLLDTDVDLWPPDNDGGPWTLKVKAQPARTDRPARGFGSFVARGEWRPSDRAITIDVKLEKSEMSDMLTLFHGEEVGLLGTIWGDAHLAGPIGQVGIAGHVNIANLHGWSQPPPGGRALPFVLGGTIDAGQQSLDLHARLDAKDSPVDLRYRVSDFLGRPQWGVTVMASRLPLAGAFDVARNLGITLPPDFHIDGRADGAVGFAMEGETPKTEGELHLSALNMTANDTPGLKLGSASLRFEGSGVTLRDALIETGAGETAKLEGSYDLPGHVLSMQLSTTGMAVSALRRQVAVTGTPVLSLATKGQWFGAVRYETAKGWSGDLQLKDIDIPFDAFAEPVHLAEAAVAIDQDSIVMKKVSASLGAVTATGDYRYEAGAERPHQFHFTVAADDFAALEKLLMPTLRRGNILTNALSLGRADIPDWLKAMHADGSLQTAQLQLNGVAVSRFKAHVLWDGPQVGLESLAAQVAGGSFSGAGSIDLSGRQPKYRLEGKLAGYPWRGGSLEGDGSLTATGTGSDLLSGLRAEGTARVRSLNLPPYDAITKGEGTFDLTWSGKGPAVRLTDLTLTSGGAEWKGSGDLADSGVLTLKLSSGDRQVNASGAVLRGEGLKPVTP